MAPDIVNRLAKDSLEFAYRACREAEHKVGDNDHIFMSLVMGRLSDLIVNECAGLFKNVYTTVEGEHGPMTVVASDYIRQHFGIES